ncbi:MAG: hypothetical protein PHG23_01490 [Candidatus Pacebacteria bacterium]|nr:hypothetical protein [Candidatus Paceibacterota bacterium]
MSETLIGIIIGGGIGIIGSLITILVQYLTSTFIVKYENLHNERAQIIKNLYQRVVKTYRSFYSYMNPLQLAGEPNQESKGKETAKLANEFTDYYEENRIFIDKKLTKEVDKLSKVFREAWAEFETHRMLQGKKEFDFKNWQKAWNIISKETPLIKEKIEDEFRGIIGIK